jgi:DNA-binding IclR family transcriptional regulator
MSRTAKPRPAEPATASLSRAAGPGAPRKVERENGIQVLARAAEILRLLKGAPAGLTQAEMALRLSLARTTVHRILSALAAEALVEPCGSGGRFRLGQEILRMAEAARSALVTEIHPHLQALSRELDETVDLSILERAQATFIDQVVANQRLRAVSIVGASFPLHCTANGKAMLASLSEREVDRVLPPELAANTLYAITSLARLHEELARVRKTGLAYDEQEHSLGISAVGMALGNSPLGLAAISIPMPVQRFAEKKAEAGAALRRTVALIEAGWREKR